MTLRDALLLYVVATLAFATGIVLAKAMLEVLFG